MAVYRFDNYEVDLPEGWTVLGPSPMITLYKADGVGQLWFFAFETSQSAAAKWDDFQGALVGEVSTNDDGKTFSRTWKFDEGNNRILLVHYSCSSPNANVEEQEVNRIMRSLSRAS